MDIDRQGRHRRCPASTPVGRARPWPRARPISSGILCVVTDRLRDTSAWRAALTLPRSGDLSIVASLDERFGDFQQDRTELGVLAGPGRRAEPGFRWVPYKEAFSPGLVRAVLDVWSDVDGPLLDQFAGVGTTLLVAAERGLPSVGVELLPYPRWVANRVLASHGVDPSRLQEMGVAAAAGVSRRLKRRLSPLPVPAGSWALPGEVLAALTALRDALPARGSSAEGDLAHLALLSVVETVSCAVKDGTSLRHRSREREGRTTRPGRRDQRLSAAEVAAAFSDRVDLLVEDLPKMPNATDAQVLGGDARRLPLRNSSMAAAIFSPPYPNRYDYSAIYQLELAFGEFVSSNEDLRGLRKRLLRSHLEAPEPDGLALDDPSVLAVLRLAAAAAAGGPAERGRTLRMLVGYFDDMYRVLGEVARVLRPGAPAACVVGTQTYFGYPIPTDLMLASLAERVGLAVEGCWLLRRKRVAVQQRVRGAAGSGGRESVLLLRRSARS